MKRNSKAKLVAALSAAVLITVVLLYAGASGRKAADMSPPKSAVSSQAADISKESEYLKLEAQPIEQSFERAFLDYLSLKPAVLGSIQLEIAGNSNPFHERTRRIIENDAMRTALAKAAQGLRYEIVRSGYADNASKTFAAELSVTYPDVGNAIREGFVGIGKASAYFVADGIADFIDKLNLSTLEQNTGYLYLFFDKAEDGIWYLSSVSDPQKSSLSLTEFGGIQLYSYDKQKKEYPIFLPLGMAVKADEKEFTAFTGAPDGKGVGAELNASAVSCVRDVLKGLSEKRLNLIFTDNSGVIDSTEKPRYLEDSIFGAELYKKYQSIEVDEEKAKRADLYLEYAECSARYFFTESDGVKGYIVDLEYTYINRTYAEKLAYAKLGKSLGSMDAKEYRSFIDENKECLLHTAFSTAQWWENEAIDADRMLLNNLVDMVRDCTFG